MMQSGPAKAEAQADAPNVFTILGGASMQYDSNVFRLPDDADTELALGTGQRSDWLQEGYVGVEIDKPYAQQEIQLSASLYKYWYEKFTYLNFTATDFDGSWQWHLTPHLSGVLTVDRLQQLNSYADYTNYSQRNVLTTNNYAYSIDWQAVGGWHPVGKISESERRNSALFVEQNSYRAINGEAGLKYVFRSGNSITGVGQQTIGQFLDQAVDEVHFLDTRFKQTGGEMRLSTALPEDSAVSGIYGRIGYLSRNFSHFQERDYSGWIAYGQASWNLTSKIHIMLSAGHDISDYEASYSSYLTNNNISLTPTWTPTEKIKLHAGYTLSSLHYRGPVVPDSGSRRDIQRSFQMGADWSPYRSVTISGSFQRQGRDSTYLPTSYQYNDLGGGLTVSVQFGA